MRHVLESTDPRMNIDGAHRAPSREVKVVALDQTSNGEYTNQRAAAFEALKRLRARLNIPNLSYYLGESHPTHC